MRAWEVTPFGIPPDRLFGWLMVAVAATGLGIERETGVLVTTLALLAAGPLVNLLAGPRAPAWLVSAVLSAFAVALPWPLSERMTLFAAVPVLQYVQSESVRLVVAAAALMIVAGQSKSTSTYAIIAGLWVFMALIWLGERQARLRARRLATRRWRLSDGMWLCVQLALTVAFAAGTAGGLPAVERWFIERAVNLDLERQSGFSTRTDLNGIESIRNSSKVALRIHDPGPYLMRGQVYGTYRMGVWTSARQGTTPKVPLALETRPPVRVQSAMDGNAILFAPLEWGDLTAASPVYQDGCRVALAREATREWAFAPVRSVRRPEPLSAAERAMYLAVPKEVTEGLASYLAPLLRPGLTDRQKVQAILYALDQNCQYTLEPGKPKGEEPIVRFLTKTKKGHCEYFASSLALLARMAGIPSRYATGYAAVERNKFGGYLMARDSDAHAWTEIYFEGEGWSTWDPTPAGWQQADENKSKLGEMLRELMDYLTERWETAWELFSQRVLRPLGEMVKRRLPWLLAFAALGLVAWFSPRLVAPLKRLWAWLLARFARPVPDATPPEARAATAALGFLEELLAGLGISRGEAVTPLELVARLEAQGQPAGAVQAARDLVDVFCRYRYGGAAWDAARADAAQAQLRAHLTKPPPAR